jgi:hypothetical protein
MTDDPELALIFKIIWRLFIITVGFCAAIIAAGIVLGIAISHDILVALSYDYAPGVEHQALRGFFLVLAFAGISFLPWAIGTVVAELIAIRSILYHLGLGAVCGALASVLHPMSDPRVLQVSPARSIGSSPGDGQGIGGRVRSARCFAVRSLHRRRRRPSADQIRPAESPACPHPYRLFWSSPRL